MSFGLEAIAQTIDAALPTHLASAPPEPAPPEDADFPKQVMAAAGAFMTALQLPTALVNTGLATATHAIAAVLPSFPAATLGSLYVGVPHAHAHPPSLIPPAPPVPLPSMGTVMFGTALNVLVGGVPAARAGDLGMAPTCGGIVPFFTILLGSSKVFFGGMRAARQTDLCVVCTPQPTAGVARSASKALKAAAMASQQAQTAMLVATVVEDAVQMATAQAAVASASAVALAMMGAQAAADAIATAMTASLGLDPGIAPSMPGFVTTGAANVQVAGMPLPNIPDLAQLLFKRVKGKKGKHEDEARERAGSGAGCSG